MRFLPAAVPHSLAQMGSSSRKLLAPSETPVPCPPRASRRGAPSLGFAFPLRDVSLRHRYDGIPIPPPSVLGVSHAPDGLLRHRPCGFISPRSHVQGSPSSGSPSHSRDDSSPPLVSLSTFSENTLRAVAHSRHVLPPRPQGFVPCEGSGSRATVFSRRPSPPPRGSFPPPGSPSRRRRSAFTPLPLVTLSPGLSSHPQQSSPASCQRRVRLPSLEAADLLEVSGLPFPPTFADFNSARPALWSLRPNHASPQGASRNSAPLLPKLRGHFAVFLNHFSLDRVGILELTIRLCLGYGPHENTLEAFLGSV